MGKQRSQRVERLIAAVVVGAAVGLVAAVAAIVRPGVLERAEFWTYDARARSSATKAAMSPDIVMIEISEQDIEDAENNFGVTWPWPREMHGYLAQYAHQAGAKAIVYDWLYQDRGFSVNDAETFATALRENGRAVIGLAMTKNPQVRTRGTEGPWVARLGEFATWEEAQATALQLLAWNTRSYVVPASDQGPFTLYYGGKKSAEDLQVTIGRLMSVEELEPMFAAQVPPPPDGSEQPVAPEPPAPIQLSEQQLAREVTIEAVIARRDALPLVAPALSVPERKGMDPPLAPIAAAPARTGNVYQESEADGIMRRHTPMVRNGGALYPSLALAAYLVANPGIEVKIDGRDLVLGSRRVPLDDEGKVGIRYHGAYIYPRFGAYEVLRSISMIEEGKAPSVPLEALKGKYVIVSASAQALRDIRNTPVSKLQEGAEVQATMLDNLERGDFIVRASVWTDAAITLLLCIVTALAMVALWTSIPNASLALLATSAATGLVLLGHWNIAAWQFDANGLWLGVATPAIGVSVSAFVALLITSAAERRGKRFVQEALGKYTSPALVKELMAHPEYLALGGDSREMSVYFSDIAGFTSFSEALSPERLVLLLNDYLTSMTDIVLEHGGTIDKYIGDAVMAFWGAPLPEKKHAERAVLCALAMRRKCEELRVQWKTAYGAEVHARAAVNSGRAVVGNMGSKHKLNYTVMGDMVNLASRLEGANKPYGTYLMISEFTLALLGDLVDVRELDFLAVKGKEQPVRVFEVLEVKGKVDPATMRAVDRYLEGLRLYRERNFTEAIAAFEAALRENPADSPSVMYIDRCRHFLDHPPEEGWDGVWRMHEK